MKEILVRSVLALVLLFVPNVSQAQTYIERTIHSFAGQPDGASPFTGLVASSTGDLYGTTAGGGAYNLGTVFQIDRSGKEKVLYSFAGTPDGSDPGALVEGGNGELYGTTATGGSDNYGTVFKIDSSGQETVLYSFAGGIDGFSPAGPLISDPQGNLYGVTGSGGTGGYGTVFKLASNGTKTILHSFSDHPDGTYPNGGLARDTAGNLYGTTYTGGPDPSCGFFATGCGIVFKVTPAGKETVFYSFDNRNAPEDGYQPSGNLISDSAGNLYGTTQDGGSDGLYGTVYQITPSGKETVLYSFYGDNDGENPYAGVVRDAAGNLYGTTQEGGNKGPCYNGFFYSGCGTVFKISPTGQETILLVFNAANGESPYGSLLLDSKGNLWGTAAGGGSQECAQDGCGVVFKLSPK